MPSRDGPMTHRDPPGQERTSNRSRGQPKRGTPKRNKDPLRVVCIRHTYCAGGTAAWEEARLPTIRKAARSGRWLPGERPTIDRIACPWLVSRFIDPEAAFLYVPSATVHETAERTGATPYDVAGVEFGHHGELCSFDAFIRIYDIADPALDRLAAIVRGADTNRPDLTPQSSGLLALSQGLKINFTDDHAMLAQGMVVYDALYAWCRAQEKTP